MSRSDTTLNHAEELANYGTLRAEFPKAFRGYLLDCL